MATRQDRWTEARAGRSRFPQPPPPDLAGIPPGPRLPRHLLGAQWLLREHRLLERCRRRYGDVFSLKMWPLGLLVVVSEPDEIKRIFTGDPELVRAGEGNAVTEPVAGPESILLLDGRRHLHTRKLMLPAFHGERIRVYGDLIGEVAEAEIDSWPLDTPFPIHPSMQAITLQVIIRAVFGIEDSERRTELERLIPKLIGSPVLLWPPLAYDLGPRSPMGRFLALRERVDAILFDEVDRRRVDPALEERDDVLSMLLLARDENGEGMSEGELRDQLVTLLLAGHETTATALAWAFERLLRNPAVLERLRAALAAGDETYLDCVVKETLRARPIIPYAIRRLTAPLEIAGYRVPAGSFVGCSTILTHSRPDLYPDPDAFRPERFEDGAADTYTWIPFGGGVRRCLGASFATFEMKVILRRVLASLRADRARRKARASRPSFRYLPTQPGCSRRSQRAPPPIPDPPSPPNGVIAMSHESRLDGGATSKPGVGDLRPGVRALRLIVAFNLLSTAVHYTHNFVMADMYPPVPLVFPTALSYQIGIAIFWPLLTVVGLWGYRLYKAGETRRPRWMLSAYAMLGFTTLGHFMGGNPDIPPFFYVTLFTDFLAGSALLVFVAWTFQQPDAGEGRSDLTTGTTLV